MDVREKMQHVIGDAGLSKISRSTYDTSWVARLGDLDWSLSSQALNWLAENQLPDGSWGASKPFYYHDRIICTLAAMLALTKRGRRGQDRRQIERGQHALESLTKQATRGLMLDLTGPTLGFDMLMPTLLADLEAHEIIPHQDDNNVLGRLTRQRRAKLSKLPSQSVRRGLAVTPYAEMVGQYELSLLDVENLLESNGSVAGSPAATAFFVLHIRPDPKAMAFLNSITNNGAAPYTGPVDTFEYAWVLWNAALADCIEPEPQPHLGTLQQLWGDDNEGSSARLSLRDGDITSITFDVLKRCGRDVEPRELLCYEEETHFRCYPFETDASISTNIHALSALRQARYETQHASVQKILLLLKQAQTGRSFWLDTRHASPYYPTAHAIIALAGYVNELALKAVEWILNTQNEDGSWGFYEDLPSAEETAYCLQALSIWKSQSGQGDDISTTVLQRGAAWLQEHIDDPYPWFWIGKSLYCPELVVESAILSALMLVESI